MRVASLIGLGRIDDAQHTLDQIRVYVYSAASSAIEAEYETTVANLNFATGLDEECAAASKRALRLTPSAFEVSENLPSLKTSHAIAMNILGLVSARAERYVEQISLIKQAVDEWELRGVDDAFAFGWLLSNLAFLVRDLGFDSDAIYLRRHLAQRSWEAELQKFAFHITRSLAWCEALKGDHLSAFRDFRTASRLATSRPLSIAAILDRAFIARALGEHDLARDEVQSSERLAQSVDWDQSANEDRVVLLLLAEAKAPDDAAKARLFLDRYLAIKAKLSPLLLARTDRRARAFERHAQGIVLLAEGDGSRAVPAFLDAFEIFKDVGYRWRAAMAASYLAQLTGKRLFEQYAAAEAGARPASWLARLGTSSTSIFAR